MLHKESSKIQIRKEVRQVGTVFTKLFTTTLEETFLKRDWNNRGLSINGGKLSNPLFADDATVIAKNISKI